SLYREILSQIAANSRPAIGVVERSISKNPVVVDAHIAALRAKNVLSVKDAQSLSQLLQDYRLGDASLISVLLAPGEHLQPIAIDRQQPANKWPAEWKHYIDSYPKALTTYLKSSEESEPFRVEMTESITNFQWVVS